MQHKTPCCACSLQSSRAVPELALLVQAAAGPLRVLPCVGGDRRPFPRARINFVSCFALFSALYCFSSFSVVSSFPVTSFLIPGDLFSFSLSVSPSLTLFLSPPTSSNQVAVFCVSQFQVPETLYFAAGVLVSLISFQYMIILE